MKQASRPEPARLIPGLSEEWLPRTAACAKATIDSRLGEYDTFRTTTWIDANQYNDERHPRSQLFLMHDNRFFQLTRLALGAVAVLLCHAGLEAAGARQADQPAAAAWTWSDGAGKTRTLTDFSDIVSRHRVWVKTAGAEGARANFTKANLQGLKIQMVELVNATFSSADLSRSDFTAVNLTGADLSGITLSDAHWSGVVLVNANLSGAFISQTEMLWTQLQKAKFSNSSVLGSKITDSNLKGAKLDHTTFVGGSLQNSLLDDADLRSAGLLGTDLSGTRFSGADLQDTAYEPITAPELRGIANAHHLESLRMLTSPDALTALRQAFVAGGYTEQRNRLTYVLKRQENDLRWRRAHDTNCTEPSCRTERLLGHECVEGACQGRWVNYFYYGLNWIFFDWTVRYGMAPEHALMLLIGQGIFFALVYCGFLHFSRRSSLIMVKRRRASKPESLRRVRYRPRIIPSSTGWRYRWNWLVREIHLIRVALFFSLLNTFHSGFNAVDPGKWIRLLTKHEYNLEPERWLRTVAGVQTVVSLFLFAMWLLTQFGHPFEA